MSKKICNKCGQEILLDKWCSYDCLKDKAEKEDIPIEKLLAEMMLVGEALSDEINKSESD